MAPQYNRPTVMKRWAAGLLLILLLDVASFAQTSAKFAIGDGGGMSFQTDGAASAAVAVGYAKVNPDPGAQPPSGLAIIDFRQNNVLVSEAGVPASGLITSGRIYAEISSTINTGDRHCESREPNSDDHVFLYRFKRRFRQQCDNDSAERPDCDVFK